MSPPTTVFVSYSHDSPEHMDQVLALSNRLRGDGFDAILDQYEVSPPEGWPLWCEAQVRESDFVLMVCTETYCRRVAHAEEPGVGLGVCWEAHFIRQSLYNNAAENTRFVPAVMAESDCAHIPDLVAGASRYCVGTKDGYQDLLQRLSNIPRAERPPIGERLQMAGRPPLDARPRVTDFMKPFLVPYPRNPFFTGREDFLDRLHDALAADGAAAVSQTQAISGLGGVGKTQVAVEYAYRHRNEYDAIFWVTAATTDTLATGYTDVARALDLPEKGEADQAVIREAVKVWLQTHDGWLLILDNADDPPLLKDFLPRNVHGRILVTSRAHHLPGIGQERPLELDEMPPEDALAFLFHRTERGADDSAEREAAATLAQELGYLPLALEQAAAYIVAVECSFATYLQSYRTRGMELLEKHKPDQRQYRDSVATTWLMSMAAVEGASPAAADVLRLSAMLAPETIPYEVLTAGPVTARAAGELQKGIADARYAMPSSDQDLLAELAGRGALLGPNIADALADVAADPLALDELLAPLTSYSLIHRQAGGWSVHRLVNAVQRDALDDNAQRLWAERGVLAVNAAFPDAEFPAWPLCERLVPHALACAAHIARWQLDCRQAGRLVSCAGCYSYRRASYGTAEPLLRQAADVYRRALGANHPYYASSLNNLAELLHARADFAAAEPLLREAMDVWRAVLGSDHPHYAASLSNLARLLRDKGDVAAAEPMFRQAVDIWRRAPDDNHPGYATALSNFANLLSEKGDHAAAESLHKQALEMRREALGDSHPDFANSLSNLALLLQARGELAAAETLFTQAMEIRRRALGETHPHFAASLNNLAALLRTKGDLSAAEPLIRQALEVTGKTLGEDHPDYAINLNNLSDLLHAKGDLAAAEPLLWQSLAVLHQALGADHPDTRLARRNLAVLLTQMDRQADAAALMQESHGDDTSAASDSAASDKE